MIRNIILLVVALFLVAANVWAVKTIDVSGTKHNLSSYSPITTYASQNEEEVCIFCHTPHGGSNDAPLWNRDRTFDGTGTGFTHYNSVTLSPTMQNISTRAVSVQSLLCLSCHDGTVAMGTIINNSNKTGGAPDVGVMIEEIFVGFGDARIGHVAAASNPGRNLSDDHPISFSYYNAFNDAANTGKLNQVNTPVTGARAKGIRFFGPDAAGGQKVECSSCHDPHVNYDPSTGDVKYSPFLVTPNTGSALCLACHIK